MEIQFPQILFQIINFGLVAFILTKFLYKPILKILDQRSEKVEAGLKAAEKQLNAEKSIQARELEIINQAKTEAKKILADSKKTADTKVAEALNQAKAEAKKALASEKQAMLSALDAENRAFKKEMISLVTSVTAKVLGDGLSLKDQEAIIRSQIKELKGLSLT